MLIPCIQLPQAQAPAQSNRPHNAKKALNVIMSAEIPKKNSFTKVAGTSVKSYMPANFFSSPGREVPGACFGPQSRTEPHLELTCFVTFPTERAQTSVKD